ncbi:hypothetical protein [Ilumatobacter sp.]|uniref:hypothetical protein n=1 Tax=Ilumatobacter sp. TaxID=1967498 RepID=UPI003B51AAAA
MRDAPGASSPPLLEAGTYLMKAAGPLVLGARRIPVAVQRLVDLLPAARAGPARAPSVISL